MLLEFPIHNMNKMFQRIGRWLVLSILMTGVSQVAHCQKPCTMNDNNVTLCSGNNLSEVPKGLPISMVNLDLSYNKIQSISSADFSAYINLRVLNLGFNSISKIENNCFASNLLLESLNLFNNSLTEIPSLVLRPLKNLKVLEMSNNLYTNSTLHNVFQTLTNLEVLSMGGPAIKWVSRDDFRPLQNISLRKFALKVASSPDHYEKGAFAVLNTISLWCDFALDTNTDVLLPILGDLRGKSIKLLRFRNLFANSYYTDEEDLFDGLADIDVKELTFYRGKFNENLLRLLLLNLQKSNVTDLNLVAVDFARSLNSSTSKPGINNLTLEKLLVQDVSNPDILRFDWTFNWFSKVINLFIINVNFNYVPCDAWDVMENIVVLNMSTNRLKNEYILNPSCQSPYAPKAEQFILSNNQLTSLITISIITLYWRNLLVIDLGNNGIISENVSCKWGPAITKLILHHNEINQSVFQCLPSSLHYLDLSSCYLDQLDGSYFSRATNLSELWLSNNKIKFIPSNWESLSLLVLTVDGNSFGVINQGSFDNMPKLAMLRAGNNPYHCNCDLAMFFSDNLHHIDVLDWPQSYICYHPENLRHTMIESYSPGSLECDITLVIAISVTSTAVVVIASMLLCWKFDVPWYLKATCQIIQSRYRSRREIPGRTHSYHAFVSYSYSDAEWVRAELLYRLENSNPPYSICIHERDFLPGKWIIDNIIENIENSRKVIFVLSRSFVNSEWCNYELYFAHQRCIGHAFEDVILVIKENINLDSLPNKFCKLRKMLSTKTYLEWPSEANKQPFFWIQLKNVLGKVTVGSTDNEGMSLTNENAFVELPVVSENRHDPVYTQMQTTASLM